jgi:hypothetical protein
MLTRRERFNQRLSGRYGEEILSSLNDLSVGRVTLQEAGDRHGITREYVRQIFKESKGFSYTAVKNIKSDNFRRDKEASVSAKKDPRYKVSAYPVGSNVHKGALAENRVLEICSSLGFDVEPFHSGRQVDLVINGYKVEIKSAYKSLLTHPRGKTPLYHFSLLESQNIVDFIICCAVPIGRFFIIPKDEYPPCGHLYIPEKCHREWDTPHAHIIAHNKYYQYLEAWHLLKAKPDRVVFSSLATPAQVAVNQ